MDVLLVEMTSIVEAFLVVSVDIREGTVTFSEAVSVCWDVLLSHDSRTSVDADCVPNSVVSEKPAIDVENEASNLRDEVATLMVPLGVFEPSGADDSDSSADMMVPTRVTTVFLDN